MTTSPKLHPTSEALARQLAVWRFRERKIVFTNGCFDLLHVGHVTYLEAARSLGNVLVVGLNTDESIRRLKGESRPLQPLEARARVLCALECVHAVVPFAEDTPLALIQRIRPDVLAKGADYALEDIVGAKFVTNHGGEVARIPLVAGYSTTKILNRIQKDT